MFSASVTVFASSSPPWSLQGLDGNFSAIVGGLNSANTFSNYIVDTGAVNAYVAALSGTQTATLAAGLQVQVKISNTNTGASTLNVGATGVKSIKNADGTALFAGQLASGTVYTFIYDGTNYQLQAPVVLPTLTVKSGTITIDNAGLASIFAAADIPIGFGQAFGVKWSISNIAGGNSWFPALDATSDLGIASTNRVRNGFFSGTLSFGTNTAKGAEAFTSFITITDAGGTTRKLMVCA